MNTISAKQSKHHTQMIQRIFFGANYRLPKIIAEKPSTYHANSIFDDFGDVHVIRGDAYEKN